MSATRIVPTKMTGTLLSVVANIAWLTTLVGLAMYAYYVYKHSLQYCNYFGQPTSCSFAEHYTWQTALTLIAGGLIVGGTATGRRHYWFREVIEGTVIYHRWSSGPYGDDYYLVIKGVNRVGENIIGERSVPPKTYHDFEVDDNISFR